MRKKKAHAKKSTVRWFSILRYAGGLFIFKPAPYKHVYSRTSKDGVAVCEGLPYYQFTFPDGRMCAGTFPYLTAMLDRMKVLRGLIPRLKKVLKDHGLTETGEKIEHK